MRKRVLVLGAGSVAPPLAQYLLNESDINLTVADQFLNRAEKLVSKSPHAQALHLDIRNGEKTRNLISKADLVISILPNKFHPDIANHCVALKKNMITASYVSKSIKNLHSEAKKQGILILNETGLDPGIDHMEAARIIDKINRDEGSVTGFISYCGGLPDPKSNTNPFGYKFSWSPKGVLLASKKPAQYLKKNKKVFIPPSRLFQNPATIHIKGIGELEGYPNRNSVPYIDLYQIHSTKTMFRGTLRYKGWCLFMHQAGKIGLLSEKIQNWGQISRKDFIRRITGLPEPENIKSGLVSHFNLGKDSPFFQCMDFLEFFSKKALPLKKGSPLDVLVALMEEKLLYKKGERDMIILQHRITAEYEKINHKEIISTLVDFGSPDGDTAMSRTVGLPLAIAAKNILNRRIRSTGAQIPVTPEIYEPILKELKKSGIEFETSIKE